MRWHPSRSASPPLILLRQRAVTLAANLPATPAAGTATAATPISSQITVYDALGIAHSVNLNFTQNASERLDGSGRGARFHDRHDRRRVSRSEVWRLEWKRRAGGHHRVYCDLDHRPGYGHRRARSPMVSRQRCNSPRILARATRRSPSTWVTTAPRQA